METGIFSWIAFICFIFILLAVDLRIGGKNSHEINYKEAMAWSGIWISLAMLFNGGVFYLLGKDKGLEFLTGYLLEYSLSVDNIFVFILLFAFFDVPKKYQKKVLFWGIIGAIIMRGLLITVGAALMAQFDWIIYIFGIFLVITGIKMALQKSEKPEPEKNPIVRIFKKYFPVSAHYEKDKFFVKHKTGLLATPLFIVLLIVESTDLVFAFDSIPAILAITRDPFIVFTSNAFAILGLRSLYFALAGFMDKFEYLRVGLSIILVFIGLKMLVSSYIHITTLVSLGIIAGVLFLAVIFSVLTEKNK
ncbi:TerC family protein [bacterium]|nr:MAG: TerC family protein [bacterium]